MSLYKNCGWWKNFDCIFEFSVKSYVTNTINLSCAKILFPSVNGQVEDFLFVKGPRTWCFSTSDFMLCLINLLLCLLYFVLEHVGTLCVSLEKSSHRIVLLTWQLSYCLFQGSVSVAFLFEHSCCARGSQMVVALNLMLLNTLT